MRKFPRYRILIIIIILLLPVHGEAVTLTPGWERVQRSLERAATRPEVWVPLAAAVIVRAGGWDESITEWASNNTPVFGSRENAERFSDYFAATANVIDLAALVFASTDQDKGSWLVQKLENVVVIAGANTLNYAVTGYLKGAAHRQRPDASGYNSFPSGHSSYTSMNAKLAEANLPFVPLSETGKEITNGALITCVAGTSWARIEADKHFLTDVLAGIALGSFIGEFFGTAFIAEISPGACAVRVSVAF